VREQVAELSDGLADTVGPVDSGRADPAAGPEELLRLAGGKAHLQKQKKTFLMFMILFPLFIYKNKHILYALILFFKI
jgi:hypothetical protein